MPTSESSEQITLVRKLRRSGVQMCAVPNGGRRTMREARILLREGVEPGVPDLLIFDPPPVDPQTLTEEERAAADAMEILSEGSRRRVAALFGVAPGVGLEMKRTGGTGTEGASEKQLAWGEALRARGWVWGVCHGWRDAVRWLSELGYEIK